MAIVDSIFLLQHYHGIGKYSKHTYCIVGRFVSLLQGPVLSPFQGPGTWYGVLIPIAVPSSGSLHVWLRNPLFLLLASRTHFSYRHLIADGWCLGNLP